MKLHFEANLDYQHAAIEAVCDLFRGEDAGQSLRLSEALPGNHIFRVFQTIWESETSWRAKFTRTEPLNLLIGIHFGTPVTKWFFNTSPL